MKRKDDNSLLRPSNICLHIKTTFPILLTLQCFFLFLKWWFILSPHLNDYTRTRPPHYRWYSWTSNHLIRKKCNFNLLACVTCTEWGAGFFHSYLQIVWAHLNRRGHWWTDRTNWFSSNLTWELSLLLTLDGYEDCENEEWKEELPRELLVRQGHLISCNCNKNTK